MAPTGTHTSHIYILGAITCRRAMVRSGGRQSSSATLARSSQWRVASYSCTYRKLESAAHFGFTSDPYGAETFVHEAIMQSRHRTYNPEQADLFYVPGYVACYFHPVLGAADWPHWPGLNGAMPGYLPIRPGEERHSSRAKYTFMTHCLEGFLTETRSSCFVRGKN